MGAPEITAFLSWLATGQHISASTQNQALSALLFLYRHVLHVDDIGAIEPAAQGKMPHRVPVVLSREDVGAILTQLTGTMRLIVMLLTGTARASRRVSTTMIYFHVMHRGALGVKSPMDRL